MNIQFGTGVLFGLPNAGNLATNPTPFKFGVLQEMSLEFKSDLKKLFGQSQFPVAKARGKIDVSCKGKFATLDPNALNQLYFGQAQVAGMTILAVDEADTVGSTGSPPVANQVTVAHTLVTDFGVIDSLTGEQFIKVTGAPASGQYSLSGSTYTFNATDNGSAVKISYTYVDGARGSTITLANQLMGYAPEFRAFLFNNFRSKLFGVELYSCTMGSLSIPTKQEDFWISDINFDAGVDASDVLGKIYADLS